MFWKKLVATLRKWSRYAIQQEITSIQGAAHETERPERHSHLETAEAEKFWRNRRLELGEIQSLCALREHCQRWPRTERKLVYNRAEEIVQASLDKYTAEELNKYMSYCIVPEDMQKILQERYREIIQDLPDEIFASAAGLKNIFRDGYNETMLSILVPRITAALSPLVSKLSEGDLEEIWSALPQNCKNELWPLKKKRDRKLLEEKICWETNPESLEHFYKCFPDLRAMISNRYVALMGTLSPQTVRSRENKDDRLKGLRRIASEIYLEKIGQGCEDYPIHWFFDEIRYCPEEAKNEMLLLFKKRIEAMTLEEIDDLIGTGYRFCPPESAMNLVVERYENLATPLISQMDLRDVVRFHRYNCLSQKFYTALEKRFGEIMSQVDSVDILEDLGDNLSWISLVEIAKERYRALLALLETAEEIEERYLKAPDFLKMAILEFL
ncbi:MAG: hypothetical protein WC831_03080 [Parcubacteria group bacterium]|jgi:hypothetical protein